MPYLLLAPRQPWEPYGQACSLQTVHWLPKGLADYNPRSTNPSDVWANDNAYHNTPPKVVAKRETTPSFRSKCIAQNQQTGATVPRINGRRFVCGSSWRFFLRRSLRRECTRMAGIHFSSYKANVSFSPFAP